MVQPITLWQEEGIKVETVTDFIFLGSKIIADSDRCHEIKRHLLPGRKAMTNLDTMLTLDTKAVLKVDTWNLPKFMSVESVMLSNHLIHCCLLLLLPSEYTFVGM